METLICAISELSLTLTKLFCTEREIRVIMGVAVGGMRDVRVPGLIYEVI
jgi:hypothetical protein